MSRKRLNLAAPELLSAAKFAVREMCNAGNPLPDAIDRLQSAIEQAEGNLEWKLEFHVTHKTWIWLLRVFIETNDGSELHKRLTKLIKKGARKTARRVYVSVDVDVDAMARLRHLLVIYTAPTLGATSRAFERIINLLDEVVFNRSPLEVLAQQGL